MIERIYEGRARAFEINQMLYPGGEPLYGEAHGGVGYCGYTYEENGEKYCTTTRTTKNPHYLKISRKLLECNIYACECEEFKHRLIICYNWDNEPEIYSIDTEKIKLEDCLITKKSKEIVFNKFELNRLIGVNFDGIIKLL